MLKVDSSVKGANGDERKRGAIVRFSLVALLLMAGIAAFALLAKSDVPVHAAPVAYGVSKIWYFAEGRVGGGFREYITLGNPSPSIDCSVQIEYLPEGTTSTFNARKPLLVKTVSIPHTSRFTTVVNTDLGIRQQDTPALLLSTLVTVTTPACGGVVAERPMYFSYHGVQSGSDVLGATSLGTSFFFADVSTASGSASFMTSYLSVLNPSVNPASVTATYYAAGHQVGMQTISVASGARGTILPGDLHMASHVAAIVTSDQPVVVERSSYLYKVQEGIAGVISSAAAIVGAPRLSDDWLFAEGYTGGQTQENLLLTNLTSIATMSLVTLEYEHGHYQNVFIPVGAYMQVIVNVNALNAHPTGSCDVSPCITTPQVSAEVSSPGMSLVAERQMFFRYNHTLPGTNINVTTMGGSDVLGALDVAFLVSNFAEGYTNITYNEWLTLQNPTIEQEQVTATLLNEYGHSYTKTITIEAKSRVTVDITEMVRQHLLQPGEDYRAHQVSMSVKGVGCAAFVAERPMYFHTGSIEGGTDVIGFFGQSGIVPTPSPTATLTATSTPTLTPTSTPTMTPTATFTPSVLLQKNNRPLVC